MSDIFISYAREDKNRVKSLAHVLEHKGWSVWWDARIPAGQSYEEVIEKALKTAKSVVVVWTENSVKSQFVKNEAKRGLRRNVLIPVMLLEEVEIPLEFEHLQAAHLLDWQPEQDHPGFEHFVEDLTRVIGAPATRVVGPPSPSQIQKPSSLSVGLTPESEREWGLDRAAAMELDRLEPDPSSARTNTLVTDLPKESLMSRGATELLGVSQESAPDSQKPFSESTRPNFINRFPYLPISAGMLLAIGALVYFVIYSQGPFVKSLATDTQDKQTTGRSILPARSAVEPAPQIPQEDIEGFGRYHALVIGNDQYTHWPKLKNAISDATAVAKMLTERYGFHVTILKDATRSQIMKALNKYREILSEKDNLLIYYAGHGHLEQGIDRGYWIPVDAETNDNSEWVLLPAVTDLLQLILAKHVMVVADSCFSGKLTRSSLAQLKPGLTDEARLDVLKQLAQERVRTAMTSGGVKPVLDAGGSGHSVFAEAFLGVLEDNLIILEARRLFDAVQARMISNSKKVGATQIPTYDPISMAGHESIGDFIFVPKR